MSETDVNCPSCGAKMECGKIEMRESLIGFLIGSFQRPNCWFVPNNHGGETKVLRSYSSRPALGCPNCGTTIILGEK